MSITKINKNQIGLSSKSYSLGSSGNIDIAATSVDLYNKFNITATTTSLNFTFANPFVSNKGK